MNGREASMKHKALIAAVALGLSAAPTGAMAITPSSSNFSSNIPSSILSALSGLGNASWGNISWGNISWGSTGPGGASWGNISWGNISWGNIPGGWDPDDGKSDGC
jgi:hypothetical protein